MAEQQIKIAVQLIDNISSELTKINSRIDSFKKSTDDAAKSAGGFSGQIGNLVEGFLAFQTIKSVGSLFLGFAKAAGEAEAATTKLSFALKGKGIDDPAILNRMVQFSAKMMELTGFTDEQIRSSQALAIRYDITGEANDRLIEGASNMARVLGMDLEPATMMLVQGLSKDSEELGRLGIKITGAAGSAERFNSVMAGLNEKFGGANAAFISGYAGKVAAATNAWDEFSESMGTTLLPVLNLALTKAAALAKALTIVGITDTELWERQAAIMQGKVNGYQKVIDEYRTASGALAAGMTAQEGEFAAQRLESEQYFLQLQLDFANKKLGKTTTDKEKTKTGTVTVDQDAINKAKKTNEEQIILEKQSHEEAWELGRKYREQELNDQDKIHEDYLDMLDKNNEAESKAWEEKKKIHGQEKKNAEQIKQDKINALSDTINSSLQTVSMFKDNSMAMFEMTKALAIAQATMNTYKGATAALDYPPPFSFIAAAAQIAFGLAQVGMISSQNYTAAATGADFITNGQRLMLVGDNPGGREHVQVTPLNSPNINGTKQSTTIIPVVILKGGSTRNDLEKATNLRQIDWERILPKGTLK